MQRHSKNPLNQISARFLEALAEEGERGTDLLVAAVADEYLSKILKKYLVQLSVGADELFKPTAPIYSFNWKIKFAYRLGLASEQLCRDLDIIRKIRNDFAHGLFDCNFESQSVKSRVSELKKSLKSVFPKMYYAIRKGAERNKVWAEVIKWKKERSEFAVCAILILTALHTIITEKKRSIRPVTKEWIYCV